MSVYGLIKSTLYYGLLWLKIDLLDRFELKPLTLNFNCM
jgi:hypothetical protein